MADLIATYGLVVLVIAVALESAGVPLPGETSLIGAAVLASQGYFDIRYVIGLAATAAILGDNAGYCLGRWGARHLFARLPWLGRRAARILPSAERFFARHGAKTVFLGRFVAGLRICSAWVAGMSRMDWRRFLVWNAAGGIVWAATVGLTAYWLGPIAIATASRLGWLAILTFAACLGTALLLGWERKRRATRT